MTGSAESVMPKCNPAERAYPEEWLSSFSELPLRRRWNDAEITRIDPLKKAQESVAGVFANS